jgi:GNAT superfamily N-acetyltransferase
MDPVRIERLSRHPEHQPLVASWFRAEWPGWYGPGGRADADVDVRDYAGEGRLPVGVLALLDGTPVGFAVVRATSLPSHPHLTPWAGAGYVLPELRGRGIGARLLAALEDEARELGFERLYCSTGTAARLLERAGWSELERVEHEGSEQVVFERIL